MCCWNSTVCQFTVIMHGRQSCGDWMIKNQKANVMRTCFMDYKNCNNGGLDCEEFHLSKRMTQHKGLCMDRKKAQQNAFVLKPKWNSVDCDVCSKPFPFLGLFTGKTDSNMVSPSREKCNPMEIAPMSIACFCLNFQIHLLL